MIHKLVLSNFYSFRDRITIDLTVPDTVPEALDRLVSPSEGSGRRYPRVVGLYGPNASGKSTVLKAISFLSFFIDSSFSIPPNLPIPVHRFGAEGQQTLPVDLELEFDAPLDLEDKRPDALRCSYFYKLSLNGGEGQPVYVEYEALAHLPLNSVRRVKLYERDKDGLKSSARAFGLQGIMKSLKRVLRPNASVISTLAQLGHDKSESLQKFASDISVNIFTQMLGSHEGTIAERYLADEKLLTGFNDYISRLDLGIAHVLINKAPNDRSFPDIQYYHRGMKKPLHITNESQGTRQFFRIFPVIFDALSSGGIAVLDELDSSIHTLLLPEIIRWFWDQERNPRNAQLWFTCQNPYLLQELAKEEVLFTEKDDTGRTVAYSLAAIKFVRRDDNYMRKYLGGAYGALPHFG